MAGIYIHIPFCASRCVYCGFFSTTALHLRQSYTDAVLHELRLRNGYLPSGSHATTVYMGGGTPSQLPAGDLVRLLDAVRQQYGTPRETTVECNPDDMTPDFAEALAEMGVNRVSMGIQTFDDRRLAWLRRRHDARQARMAVSALREAGIENVSIDLMFGFPGQQLSDWQDDLNGALSLEVPHMSAYSLMVEKGTLLAKWIAEGQVSEPDEELCLRMYDEMADRLTSAGYEHYEISNFARPGYRSVHNSNYWNGTPYLGLGTGAHSYDGISRQWNVADLDHYLSAIAREVVPAQREELDTRTKVNDLVATALRTCDGLDLTLVLRQFGEDYRHLLLQSALPHIRRGLLRQIGDRIILTRRGIHLSDSVMSDLMII